MSLTPFDPAPLARGGQRQTLLGVWYRDKLRWTRRAEDLVVDSDAGVRILARASWQEGRRAACPALVLVHGLGGTDAAGYVIATSQLAFDHGWHVVRMNMRGAGDGEIVCAQLYNAGLSVDLLAVLAAVSTEVKAIAVAGFSLGANLALLSVARAGKALPAVRAVAAVSPPLDLGATARSFERLGNRFYQFYFTRNLKAAYRRAQRRRPDLYQAGRERGVGTVREYDEAITAPYGGFKNADEYYECSSAGPLLAGFERPALVLAAEDDPLVPAESVKRWPLPASGLVQREMTPTGGHVGFVAPTRAPGRFWAAERVLAFASEALGRPLDAPEPVAQAAAG